MRGNDMSISAAADTDDLQQTLEDQILHIDGLRSWMMALLGHLVIFTTWGFVNAFGIFQTYYVRDLKLASDSQVAWIGSTQLFLLFAIGILSGRALDRGYFRITFIIGSAIQLIGIFMLSLCTVYWQVFLTQAVCVGFGNGIVFVPSVALISTYFKRYRALALGLATIGSATGGMIFSAIAGQMLPRAGFAWTVRTMGFVQLAVAATCSILLKVQFLETGILTRNAKLTYTSRRLFAGKTVPSWSCRPCARGLTLLL